MNLEKKRVGMGVVEGRETVKKNVFMRESIFYKKRKVLKMNDFAVVLSSGVSRFARRSKQDKLFY